MNSTKLEITLPPEIAALPLILNEKAVLAYIAKNGKCTNGALASHIGMTERGVKKILRRLRERGFVSQTGKGCARRLGLTFSINPGTAFPVAKQHAPNPNRERSSQSKRVAPAVISPRAIRKRVLPLEDDYEQTMRLIYEMTRTTDFFPETIIRTLQPLIRRVETEVAAGPAKEEILRDLYSREGAFLAVSLAVKFPKEIQHELSEKISGATPQQLINFRQLAQTAQLNHATSLLLTSTFSDA